MAAFNHGGRWVDGSTEAWTEELGGVATGVPYYYAVPGPPAAADGRQVGDLMAWGVGNGFYGVYNDPRMVMQMQMPMAVPEFGYFGGAPAVAVEDIGGYVGRGLEDGMSGVYEEAMPESSQVFNGVEDEVLEREIGDFVPQGLGNVYDEVSILSNIERAEIGYRGYADVSAGVPVEIVEVVGREMGEFIGTEFGNGRYWDYGEIRVGGVRADERFRDQVKGFLMAAGELMRELGRGCCDVVWQSLNGVEDAYVVKKIRRHWAAGLEQLGFLNDYLPEDCDPVLAWPVVICVFLVLLVALNVNSGHESVQQLKKLNLSSPSASLIQIPDGRYIAYCEQGVPAEQARFSMITTHSFLSSRLAGIPGVKSSLLEEFGVRLISYDLPGFGESDPYPGRNLNSSAMDINFLTNALGIKDKFWVLGYSAGSVHAWATVRYIPERLAGVAMFAPLVNPYDPSMNKEERHKTWEKWTAKRKLFYVLARRFPSLLPYFYRRSFLSGKHDRIENCLSYSLGKKDKALFEDILFLEHQDKDMAESIRQGDPKPFVEESMLQVSDQIFSLADIRRQKQQEWRDPFMWLKSLYSPIEGEWTGFLGPIHIWQGMDDSVVPISMTEFTQRIVPGVIVHKLLGEGHFSYFCFCDDCHRQIFSTLFGSPQGPTSSTLERNLLLIEGYNENQVIYADNATGQ